MSDFILKAENISYRVETLKGFSSSTFKEILNNVSFSVERGSIVGITGKSGSGKTTLLKMIVGIISPAGGSLQFNFLKDWNNSPSKPVQILFQNDGELINPYRKVSDVLTDVFEIKFNKRANYANKIVEHFQLFDMSPDLLNRKGYQLSGGEQQRIALARIVLIEPEILILDEPFSSQDVEAQLNILELIKKIKDKFNLTVLVVTHDLKIINKLCDKIIIMRNGEIIESGFTTSIITNPQNAHTKFLLKAQSIQLTKSEINNIQEDEQN